MNNFLNGFSDELTKVAASTNARRENKEKSKFMGRAMWTAGITGALALALRRARTHRAINAAFGARKQGQSPSDVLRKSIVNARNTVVP